MWERLNNEDGPDEKWKYPVSELCDTRVYFELNKIAQYGKLFDAKHPHQPTHIIYIYHIITSPRQDKNVNRVCPLSSLS